MILATDLIAKFQQALAENWGYIYGKTHTMWSEEKQKAYVQESLGDPDRANSVKYGSKWAGHWVTDCSGLFAWAFKELGVEIAHGSNSIWSRYCSNKGVLTADVLQHLLPGAAVFTSTDENGEIRHNHIGLYVGHETVIEAQGCQAGVTTSPITNKKWTHFGLLRDVILNEEDNETMYATVALPTGASGNTVNMRRDADKNAKVVTRVPVGATVAVIEDRGEWCAVSYQGSRGYMMANYLEYPNQAGEAESDTVAVPKSELRELHEKIGRWLA